MSKISPSAEIKIAEFAPNNALINFKPFTYYTSVYKLTTGNSIIFEYPGNFDKTESETEILSPDEIEKIMTEYYHIKPNVVPADKEFFSLILELRTGKEIWQYLLIFTLLFLAFEFYLSRSLMKG